MQSTDEKLVLVAGGVGTGGPLEAGTLSEAGAPLPFSGRLKAILAGLAPLTRKRFGASKQVERFGRLTELSISGGVRPCRTLSVTLAIDFAVAGSTLMDVNEALATPRAQRTSCSECDLEDRSLDLRNTGRAS